MSIETTQTLIYTLIAVIAFFGLAGIAVIGWYRFKCVINIAGEQLAKDYQRKQILKDMNLQKECEGDQEGWCEVCAIVYEEEDPCPYH